MSNFVFVHRKMRIRLIIGVICSASTLILLFSYLCNNKVYRNVLKQAGDNKSEIQKVIAHYQQHEGDSLKLKAAYFLIENMPFHHWANKLPQFDWVFDSIVKYPDTNMRREHFDTLLISEAHTSFIVAPRIYNDVQSLKADYLIENIDLAFEAWLSHPANKRADFKIFCNYILPYRNADEEVEPGARRHFMERYHWVFDSLKANVPLKSVADKIINTFHYSNLTSIREKYPVTLSIAQYEKSRIGLCEDGVNYFVDLFRALGIVSSDEYIEHWGNHPVSGHSWLRLEYGKEVYCEKNIRDVYKFESIPKVFRRTFTQEESEYGDTCFYKDVTAEYTPTVNVDINVLFNEPKSKVRPVLCVFDAYRVWANVIDGKFDGHLFRYKNIGVNVLYLPAYYISGNLYPVNYPFFVSRKKTIHYWNPRMNLHQSCFLLRKTGFTTPRNTWKRQWLDSLNHGFFEGANNPRFLHASKLSVINHLNSPQPQLLKTKYKKNFRFVRFNANMHESYLASLEFLNRRGKKLSGVVIKENCQKFWKNEGAFDDDPLTFSGGRNFKLGLQFKKTKRIRYIRFQARNDDNHIHKGDIYELFYWNKMWTSLGRKTATDTVLTYNSVPRNALFWLKDISRGREENVFAIDGNGRQRWLGFSE